MLIDWNPHDSLGQLNPKAHGVCHVFFLFFKEHGTSVTQQMERDFPIIPGKPRRDEYLWRCSFFPEKCSVGKSVPFHLPPDQSDFPYKKKAPKIVGSLRFVLSLHFYERAINFDWQADFSDNSLSANQERYFLRPWANGGFQNVARLIAGGFSFLLLNHSPIAFSFDFGPGFPMAIVKTITRKSTPMERGV